MQPLLPMGNPPLMDSQPVDRQMFPHLLRSSLVPDNTDALLSEVVEKLYGYLFKLAWDKARPGNRYDADDLVQQSMLNMLTYFKHNPGSLKDLLTRGMLYGYAAKVLHNSYYAGLRKDRSRRDAVSIDSPEFPESLEPCSSDIPVEETVTDAETVDEFVDIISKLKEPYKTVMLLRLKDLSLREISARLGLRHSTTGSYIRRAKAQLHALMKGEEPELRLSASERSHILELREPYLTVARLYLDRQLTYAQISKMLGRPVGTVKSQLYRARLELQQLLKEETKSKHDVGEVLDTHLISQLQEPHQKMITLHFKGKWSYHEIAKRYGLPVGTVKSMVSRSIQYLKMLEQQGCQEEVPGSGRKRILRQVERRQLQYINKLPELYQEVVRLYYNHGLTYAKIAAEKKLPVGTVKARVNRGIDLLARYSAPYIKMEELA